MFYSESLFGVGQEYSQENSSEYFYANQDNLFLSSNIENSYPLSANFGDNSDSVSEISASVFDNTSAECGC